MHFPSPNEQTIQYQKVIAMGCNGNPRCNPVSGFPSLLMTCSSRVWILLAYHNGLPEGTVYFQVFLHFSLYINCLSKTVLTVQPDPPRLSIDQGACAHLFSAASNFGRSPCGRRIQQSDEQSLWRWSSVDIMQIRGFS